MNETMLMLQLLAIIAAGIIGWVCACHTIFKHVKIYEWIQIVIKYGVPLYVLRFTDFTDKLLAGII